MSDSRKFIEALRKLPNLIIYVHNDIVRLCELSILVNVLTRECIKHEIVFVDDHQEIDSSIEHIYLGEYTGDKNNVLLKTVYKCSCLRKDCIAPVVSMYRIAKKLNHLDNDTIWPLAVYYMYFKHYMYVGNVEEDCESDEESVEHICANQNICEECTTLYNELFIEIKRHNSGNEDGIVINDQFFYPLLEISTLFEALKNDIFFIVNKKLYYRQKGYEDRKIQEYLAQKGVANSLANEKYSIITLKNKKNYSRIFGKTVMLYKKKGHTSVVSAVDNLMLMYFYLMKSKPLNGFLCLHKTIKSVNFKKIVEFYTNLMNVIKDSISKVSRAESLYIFKLRNFRPSKSHNMACVMAFVNLQIGVFVRTKLENQKYLVLYENKTEKIVNVFGDNIKIGSIKVAGFMMFEKDVFYKALLMKSKEN